VNIEVATKLKRGTQEEEHEHEPEPVVLKPDTPPSPRKKNGLTKTLSQNGFSSVISKESLILVPEGETIIQNGHVDTREEIDNVINNNNEKSDNQVMKVSTKSVIDMKVEC
jgi:hypothetical protein